MKAGGDTADSLSKLRLHGLGDGLPRNCMLKRCREEWEEKLRVQEKSNGNVWGLCCVGGGDQLCFGEDGGINVNGSVRWWLFLVLQILSLFLPVDNIILESVIKVFLPKIVVSLDVKLCQDGLNKEARGNHQKYYFLAQNHCGNLATGLHSKRADSDGYKIIDHVSFSAGYCKNMTLTSSYANELQFLINMII
ncbi:hypothetical protein BPAE_0133g00270 [Botrytis paeoniae]|uniref:Uncharacterized protein n=1 Tax=Botrytis paeoniae TaxID=278948 RepID=A0A4Z1FJ93_9HELO|nr:hypothetical protein BPAE_0133g00270 [Botrytis paeoniae]